MGRDGFEEILLLPDIAMNENRSSLISQIPGNKLVRLYSYKNNDCKNLNDFFANCGCVNISVQFSSCLNFNIIKKVLGI